MVRNIHLKAESASQETLTGYGFYIGSDIGAKRLPIPFYDNVDEGENLPFEYTGQAVIRTARIHPDTKPRIWLERHMRMTQLFIGLGSEPFGMIMCAATHNQRDGPTDLPVVEAARAFRFAPGTGVLLWKGTWHDFPLAISAPVTCLTANSGEVVEALVGTKAPREMDEGDVYKVNIFSRFGLQLTVEF